MPKPTKEEILYAFAVEKMHDRVMLANYLRDYPEYAADLIDLSYELSLEDPPERELTEADQIMIDRAWNQHKHLFPECPFCFEQRECSAFPVFVNHDDETVWMDGCDDCIAHVNPEYARQLGLIMIAHPSEAAHV